MRTNPAEIIILNVDDNEGAIYAKSRLLRKAGYQVIESGKGLEAIHIIQTQHPHLALIDVHLPDMDGLEVSRRIKADPATAGTIILQISASSVSSHDRTIGLDGGADAYITEPIAAEELLANVKALLRLQAREEENAQLVVQLQKEVAERRKIEVERERLLVSEQIARREAEHANHLKDEFLATVSHELKTPLTSILGWAQMLLSAELDESKAAKALKVIERHSRLQVQLVNDLLDVSGIIAGKLRLNVRPMDARPIIESAVETVRPAAEAKGIVIRSNLDKTVGPIVADPDRLQQIVWNLVSNAVKYTQQNGEIDVRLETANGQATITVSDTGIGITPEFLPYVFERFRQEDNHMTTRKYGGLGLGLAIVRHLVEMHGGTVSATSEGAGLGSTFTVCLPLMLATSGADIKTDEVSEQEGKAEASRRLAGIKILLVDDDPDVCDLLTLIFIRAGADVKAAITSVEAIALLDQAKPDIIVSDIAMPGEDGYAFLRKVRIRTPEEGGQIPAIAITARSGANDHVRSLRAGFQSYVPKPIDQEEILTVVETLAARRPGRS